MTYGAVMAELLAVFVLALVGVRILLHPRSPWRALDVPNARSLHKHVVPRTGGLAILFAVGAGMLMMISHVTVCAMAVAVTVTLVAGISWYDDQYAVRPLVRLVAHIFAALIVAVLIPWPRVVLPGLGGSFTPVMTYGIVVCFLVWWANLYNFMDGMDGFAGGMAVIGFGTLAILGLRHHDLLFMQMNATVSLAALGFTLSNFPPARLFMGDVGAVTIGFLVGIMMLIGAQRGDVPLWASLIIFSPFWVDATITLLKRLMRGENVTVAHRDHYYQRLVRTGLGHQRVVLGEYVLMVSCAVSAYQAVGRPVSVEWGIILFWAMVYVFLARAVKTVGA